MSDAYDFDGQDQSEVFDEDMTDDVDSGPNSHEMKTFEEMPDVLDVTTVAGDGADDLALDEDQFVDGALDDDDLEEDSYEFADEELDGDDLDSTDVEGLDEADGVALQEDDEVELVYAGDVNDSKGAQSSAAHFESRGELAQDDVDELGYGDDEEEEEEVDRDEPGLFDDQDDGLDDDDDVLEAAADDDEPRVQGEDRAFDRGTSNVTADLAAERGEEAGAERDTKARQDALLDESLEETFPGSDPISPKRIT